MPYTENFSNMLPEQWEIFMMVKRKKRKKILKTKSTESAVYPVKPGDELALETCTLFIKMCSTHASCSLFHMYLRNDCVVEKDGQHIENFSCFCSISAKIFEVFQLLHTENNCQILRKRKRYCAY